ncbi:DUF4864 domain-containing protein [Roseivirga sp. BDSF3-8]|uniref:DUF4864 domain-containing protein n=1 Tax=Roseivirga sp. BDSF3-8 TaxID=3241598 RepID=UPI003532460E
MNGLFSTTRYIILIFFCFVIYCTAFLLVGGMVDDHGKNPDALLSSKQAQDMHLLSDHPIPHPELSPEQVVSIQLTALQQNDSRTNEGIVVTFNYASPQSQTWTGPLHRFVEQVKSPAYKPLFQFKGYILDDLIIDGRKAYQYVVLLDQKNEATLYLFTLRQQRAEPFEGCWMTEDVEKVEVERSIYYL